MMDASVKDMQDTEGRARSALATSPIYLLRFLDVEQAGDALLISGRVDSFYHKQLAQEVVGAVCNKLQIVNEIEVDPT